MPLPPGEYLNKAIVQMHILKFIYICISGSTIIKYQSVFSNRYYSIIELQFNESKNLLINRRALKFF